MNSQPVNAPVSPVAVREPRFALCLALILAITLLGAALRIYKITEWSLWDDEVYTIRDAYALTDPIFKNPEYPISFYFARLAIYWWGPVPGAIRFFPCLFGILAIPILYFLSRRIFGDWASLLAAFILAISPWHLYKAQNARGYTLLLLLALISMWIHYIGLERNKPWMWILSWLLFIAAFFTQYVAGFLAMILLAYPIVLYVACRWFGFEQPSGLKKPYWAIFFILLAAGLIFACYKAPDFMDRMNQGLYSFGKSISSPPGTVASIGWRVTWPVFILSLVGMIDLLRRRDRRGLFFGLALVLPITILALLSLKMPAWPRYVLITTPPMFILAGYYILQIIRDIKEIRWLGNESVLERILSQHNLILGCALIGIVTFQSLFEDAAYYTATRHGLRSNFRDAYATIKADLHNGDLIAAAVPAMAFYYLGDLNNLEFTKMRAAENRKLHQVFDSKTPEGVYYENVKLEGLDAHDFAWLKERRQRTWFVVADYNWVQALKKHLRPEPQIISNHISTNGFTDRSLWVLLWEPAEEAPSP